ncbi:hypothetical protein GPECTOR_41g698 [Gonium pectorale]|uniref:Uncharacterized protein n=1 Tax=Gonium pectorale TaxID=33097 RepID=A0A150GAD7_GONPE|nr:hypothetical protein GPECTOR_41g698 [Gonium pectorale]|eukprot:KXZ46733.1 hypothetical protein GPECTOR_41g698 [Gonium pectorale]
MVPWDDREKGAGLADPDILSDLDLDLDEGLGLDLEEVDLDSPSWRMATWEAAQELLQSRAFPLPMLPGALPLGRRALAVLRCRTGSADDMDFYVPQLRTQDVARHNASAGRLAEWLLGVEAHCRAAHELDAAWAWEWPGAAQRRAAALAGADAGAGDEQMREAVAQILEARRAAALEAAEAEAQVRAAAEAAEAAQAAAAAVVAAGAAGARGGEADEGGVGDARSGLSDAGEEDEEVEEEEGEGEGVKGGWEEGNRGEADGRVRREGSGAAPEA